MVVNGSLLPQIPTTPNMRRAESALSYDALAEEVSQLANLYRPLDIPAEWLPLMFDSFGCLPLYSEIATEAQMREVYANLYLADSGGEKDGIFWQRHGERALRLFSEAIGLTYSYTIRRQADGRPVGITFYITPLGSNTDFYRTSAPAQSYLRRAYEWLLGKFLTIDNIFFQTRHSLQIGFLATSRVWVEA